MGDRCSCCAIGRRAGAVHGGGRSWARSFLLMQQCPTYMKLGMPWQVFLWRLKFGGLPWPSGYWVGRGPCGYGQTSWRTLPVSLHSQVLGVALLAVAWLAMAEGRGHGINFCCPCCSTVWAADVRGLFWWPHLWPTQTGAQHQPR